MSNSYFSPRKHTGRILIQDDSENDELRYTRNLTVNHTYGSVVNMGHKQKDGSISFLEFVKIFGKKYVKQASDTIEVIIIPY